MAKAAPPVLEASLQELVLQFVPVMNPTGQEGEMMSAVTTWLSQRDIPYAAGVQWGVHFEVSDNTTPKRLANGNGADAPKTKIANRHPLLLMAHLDSEPRYLMPEALGSLRFDFFSQEFTWAGGPIGLDCKLGVVMCLAAAEQVRAGRVPGARLKVLFTLGEEVGQRGLLRMPLKELRNVTAGVELAVALDRSTHTGSALDVAVGSACCPPHPLSIQALP